MGKGHVGIAIHKIILKIHSHYSGIERREIILVILTDLKTGKVQSDFMPESGGKKGYMSFYSVRKLVVSTVPKYHYLDDTAFKTKISKDLSYSGL